MGAGKETKGDGRPREVRILYREELVEALFGLHSDVEIRAVRDSERVFIEDHLFDETGERHSLCHANTCIAIQGHHELPTLSDIGDVCDFGLTIAERTGAIQAIVVAYFVGNRIEDFIIREPKAPGAIERLGKKLNETGLAQWLARVFQAYRKDPVRLHITATRFLRFRQSANTVDRLTDLCISLETLLGSQTEIQFRFSVCLARLGGNRGDLAKAEVEMLQALYKFRSKVLHGDPAYRKLLKNIEPRCEQIGLVARKKLVLYFLFLSENSKSKWEEHLNAELLS